MMPDEDTLNTPAILAKLRARIAVLESERADFDTALDAAHSVARRLQSQRDTAQAEAAEARAAADSMAANVATIAGQRDEARRDFENESIALFEAGRELEDMRRQRDVLLHSVEVWCAGENDHMLTSARDYCRDLTPADRARDAQQQAGQRAAEDAKPETGSAQWWADCDEIPY